MGFGLGVDAIEDRDLGSGNTLGHQSLDRLRDGSGFSRLVVVLGEIRRGSGRSLPDELQASTRDATAGGSDHAVGQTDHLRSGSVVALEADHHRLREPPGEVEKVTRGCAGERVDRLVGITHHRQVVPLAQPGVEQRLLRGRHILVLVDHKAAISVAELFGDHGMVVEDGTRHEQQVVEIEELIS